MAGRTIGGNPVFGKLPVVIIGVTIGAAVVLYRGGKFLFMARFAGNSQVAAFEFKGGFVVIKIFNTGNCCK